MLFEDGNRIDLSLYPPERLPEIASGEGMWRVLLDKDGLAAGLPKPSAARFEITLPSARLSRSAAMNSGGSAPMRQRPLRQEHLYAVWHIEAVIRKELLKMLGWWVGTRSGWHVQLGKQYKYLRPYLDDAEWDLLTRTCRLDKPVYCWQALFASQRLFRHASRQVAEHFGFAYPPYDENITPFIEALHRRWQEISLKPD
jgi:aminoglycoside 6-adenylyltransferase